MSLDRFQASDADYDFSFQGKSQSFAGGSLIPGTEQVPINTAVDGMNFLRMYIQVFHRILDIIADSNYAICLLEHVLNDTFSIPILCEQQHITASGHNDDGNSMFLSRFDGNFSIRV